MKRSRADKAKDRKKAKKNKTGSTAPPNMRPPGRRVPEVEHEHVTQRPKSDTGATTKRPKTNTTTDPDDMIQHLIDEDQISTCTVIPPGKEVTVLIIVSAG